MAVAKPLLKTVTGLLRLVLWLLILLPCCLWLVFSNEALTRTVLLYAADQVPGLTLANSHGNLWQGLQLQQLHYQQAPVNIQIDTATLELEPLALLRGRLIIRQLHSDGLRLYIEPGNNDSSQPIVLPTLYLPLHIGVQQLALRNNHIRYGEQQVVLDQLELSAYWRYHQLSISALHLRCGEQQLRLDGELHMRDDWPLNINAHWQAALPDAVAEIVQARQASGQLQITGSVQQLHIQQQTHAPVQLSGSIELAPLASPLQVRIDQQWQALKLQLAQQTVQLQQGRGRLNGNLAHYTLALHTALTLDNWPSLTIQLEGQGNDSALQLTQLHIRNQQQQLAAQGEVGWSPDIRWQLQGTLANINPAMLSAELPGSINAEFNSSGHYHDVLEMQLALDKLSGQLRGHALSGYSHNRIHASASLETDTRLQLADNRLQLHGSAGEQLAMQLQLHGQHLAQLWPELAGTLHVDAQLTGNRQQPLLHADVEASDLVFQNLQLQQLQLNVDADSTQQTMRGQLRSQQLHINNQLIAEQLQLNANGNLAQHQLQLQWQHPSGQLSAALQGGLDTGLSRWQASLEQLNIRQQQAGAWQLQQPVDMQLSAQQSRISRLCLQQQAQQGELCLEASQQQDNIDAGLALHSVPLAPLSTLLAEQGDINTMLNANASLKKHNGQWQAQLQANAHPGYIRLLEEEEESLRISWQTLQLNANLENEQYQATLQLALDDDSTLTQQLSGDISNAQALNGRLQLHFNQLHWLELFVPSVREVQGSLLGDVRISGSTEQPQFNGQLQLQNGKVQIPLAGLQLDNIGLRLTAAENGLIRLEGQLYSDNQPLLLSGEADHSQAFPWPIHMQLQGDNVLLLNRSDAVVRLDPDIRITLADKTAKVRGKVNIREARISLRELPRSAVSLSSDTVIVGEQQQTSRWQLDNDITVLLGKKVSVQGMGLDARFTGDVRIEDKPQKPLTANGVVRIEDGRYKAYGQNLKVERGNLYFQGPPDDPGLDIVATRTLNTYNTKAGLEIGGTLKNPRSRVFSEPAMDETEAMALLLTGKPLSGANESDGNAIMQAIAVYGIEQGDFITEKLSDTLGLEVGFDTSGETNEAAFTLGKQLSSRLYLRYSVSLFESISTIMLRYSLSKHINLETRTSGQSQSIDLMYRRER